MRYILSQSLFDGTRFLYVSHLPGNGGVDWGYSTQAAKALHVDKRTAARFRRDMIAVRAVFSVTEVAESAHCARLRRNTAAAGVRS